MKLIQSRILIIAALFIVSSQKGTAQHNLYVIGGLEFNGGNYCTFLQNESILQPKISYFSKNSYKTSDGISLGLSGGIQYQLSRLIFLETGIRFSEMDLIFHDRVFQSAHPSPRTFSNNFSGVEASDGNFDFVQWYWTPYVSTYLFLNDEKKVLPYLNIGFQYSFLASGSAKMSGTYSYQTGEELIATVNYRRQYSSAFAELGIKIYAKNKNWGKNFFVGLRYNLAGEIISGDYQNVQNGLVNYNDQVTAIGSYWGLTLRISGALTDPKKIKLRSVNGRSQTGTEFKPRRVKKVRLKASPSKSLPNSLNNH